MRRYSLDLNSRKVRTGSLTRTKFVRFFAKDKHLLDFSGCERVNLHNLFGSNCLIEKYQKNMPRLLQILVLPILLALPLASQATHIVGGEMTYTCLGNNLYEIKLTIFRDSYNGIPNFDDPASIGIFYNSSNQLMQEVLIDFDPMLNDTLNPDLADDCFVVPPDVCVHTTTYTAIVTLPNDPAGYHLVYQRCCRNQTISNLIQPDSVGATYSIQVGPQALLECNSSPVFNNWPPLYLCVNQPFQIDQSAIDPDGDSLVYRLCDPLEGATPNNPRPQPPNAPPYVEVPWASGYGVDNQIGGMPPMAIDPLTGLLTGHPNIIGQFVIGICVEEYRNGVLIGLKRRDYQVNIGLCGLPTAAFFTPEVQCGFEVELTNQSAVADDFLWVFNDPNNPGATSTEFNPTYNYAEEGNYEIMLIAEPGTICSDTFFADVNLLAPPEVLVNPENATIKLGESVNITASYDENYDYLWTPSEWLSDTSTNAPTAMPQSDISYTILVTDSAGCTTQAVVNIFVITLCEEPYVFIPTGFTPNGDGRNDSFKVIGNDLDEVYLIVYNRWGEQLFESNDPSVGWDGTFKGKELPPDAYGFYAEVKCLNGDTFVKKGNVTLIR